MGKLRNSNIEYEKINTQRINQKREREKGNIVFSNLGSYFSIPTL